VTCLRRAAKQIVHASVRGYDLQVLFSAGYCLLIRSEGLGLNLGESEPRFGAVLVRSCCEVFLHHLKRPALRAREKSESNALATKAIDKFSLVFKPSPMCVRESGREGCAHKNNLSLRTKQQKEHQPQTSETNIHLQESASDPHCIPHRRYQASLKIS
jgi:hypothetical protein